MWWRLPRREFDAGKGEPNKAALRAIVAAGQEPGILAYDDGVPVGWCAVAPREVYPGLERSRTLKPVDDRPVWSVSCFFVARSHRHRGVATQLLRAAVDFAFERGAQTVEGYPVEPRSGSMPDVFAWTGTASTFRQAGFVEVLRRSETRPIMRYSSASTIA
jgi:GNAT superfamily N-acetyltransferase